jgi:hypothetical protein
VFQPPSARVSARSVSTSFRAGERDAFFRPEVSPPVHFAGCCVTRAPRPVFIRCRRSVRRPSPLFPTVRIRLVNGFARGPLRRRSGTGDLLRLRALPLGVLGCGTPAPFRRGSDPSASRVPAEGPLQSDSSAHSKRHRSEDHRGPLVARLPRGSPGGPPSTPTNRGRGANVDMFSV